ncbi:MAG: 50S ribosomal protein L10 [Spirochaetae bacterium HGW-Spirochaetae-1]|jgi:large subunit ribosomal protein L10|nr:MAG: 50S ribosomal protein L10 [Spirochaetae bacterium HGW-Spirochaetae-1]
MVKQYKIDEVGVLVSQLKNKKDIFLTNYSGIKVKDLGVLRRKLREKNADYKVVKNSLFKRALTDVGYSGVDDFLKGPIGVAFVSGDVGEIAKILKEFGDEHEKFSYTAGVIDNVVYGTDQVKKIASLPSKEVLLSQTMSMINAPASYIAMGMNQIIASLARGIKAVSEKNS